MMAVRGFLVPGLPTESPGSATDNFIQSYRSDLAAVHCIASYIVANLTSAFSCRMFLYRSSILMLTSRVSVRFHRFQDTIPNKTALTSGSLNLSLGLSPSCMNNMSFSTCSSFPTNYQTLGSVQSSSHQAQPASSAASSAASIYLGTWGLCS